MLKVIHSSPPQANLLRDELQRVAAERDEFLQERNDIQTTLDARIEAATAGGRCNSSFRVPYFQNRGGEALI